MGASSVDARKQRLRHFMRARLDELDVGSGRRVGEAVALHLDTWAQWSRAPTVALYSTLEGEVDCEPVMLLARRMGKRVLLPRMIPGRSLEFAHVESLRSMEAGRYGVLEPAANCPRERLPSESIVLVPGLAFDCRGGRLGRGAGYYDRAFAARDWRHGRPILVGVGFSFQVVESVPGNRTDVRMSRVVTESGFCTEIA